MSMVKTLTVLAAALMIAGAAFAGNLRIGAATVQGETVTVPVMLEGDVGDGAAAASFNVNYDPRVLEPVQISAGAAATAASKSVQGNVREPGGYSVIMMGMNMTSMAEGEVATIQFRRVGQSSDGQTNISITNTSIASPQGDEIPSRGSTESVKIGDETGEEDSQDGDDSEEPETPDDQDTTPDDGSKPGDDSSDNGGVVDMDDATRPSTPTTRPETPIPGATGDTGTTDAASEGDRALDLQELSSAVGQAGDRRESLPAIGGRPDMSMLDSGQPGGSAPSAGASASSPEGTQSGATPTAAPGATDNAMSTAEPGADGSMTVAKVGTEPMGSVAQGIAADQAAGQTPATDATQGPGQSTGQGGQVWTFVFIGAVVVIIAGFVLVRKRLFG